MTYNKNIEVNLRVTVRRHNPHYHDLEVNLCMQNSALMERIRKSARHLIADCIREMRRMLNAFVCHNLKENTGSRRITLNIS
jgi:hypothetical protein